MSAVESSIQATVQQLESVAQEISQLRDAVKHHRDAASGLDLVSRELSALSDGLGQLPDQLKAEFAGANALIQQLEATFRPAGPLESAVSTMQSDMSGMREELKDLRRVVEHQQAYMLEKVNSLLEMGSHTKNVVEQIQVHAASTAKAQADDIGAVKTRLAKLTGLARRGFLALLRGKDAEPVPLD